MTNPYAQTALVEDRQKTLRAAADRHRLLRQARSGARQRTGMSQRWIARLGAWLFSELNKRTLRPEAKDIPVSTTREPAFQTWMDSISDRSFIPTANRGARRHDTSAVVIRPIDSSDRALLSEGFARLSARSRQLRFHGAKTSLSPAELDHFTVVDHQDREALVALSKADGRGIGVARYARDPDDPQSAEVAVTVIDDWHRRGIGTELITRLIKRAQDEGIRRFTALVTNDNTASVNLLRSLHCDVTVIDRDHKTTEYEITFMPSSKNMSDPAAACTGDSTM